MKKYLVILLFVTALPAIGQPLHVDSPFAVIGNSVGGGAFLVDQRIAPSARSQQVYGASDFLRVCTEVQCRSNNSPLLITELRFVTVVTFFEANLDNVRIELSTTPKAPDGLSATFAENVGADSTVVYSGALRLTIGLPSISLQTPFLYDPSHGNLLLDVRNFVTAIPPPLDLRQFLGENTRGDTISQIASFDVNSATARFFDSGGMVTRFQVTVVPEPGTVLLLILGFSALAAARWRRTRSSPGVGDSPVPPPKPQND